MNLGKCQEVSNKKDRYFHLRSICPFYVISELHNLINLRHKLLGEPESCDDLLVMLNVLSGERSLLAVFEPILQWLISSDVLLPLCLRYVIEILCLADIHPAVFIFGLYDLICSVTDKAVRFGIELGLH